MMMGVAFFGGVSGIALAQNNGLSQGNVQVLNDQLGINPDKTTGINAPGTGQDQQAGLIQIIKNFINWTLGILALITLVLLLWGGFQMVTAAGDDGKYKAGFKILKQAAIGLAFIALAWFMVSIIFWLIGTVGAKTTGSATNP